MEAAPSDLRGKLSTRDREILRGLANRIDPADSGAHNNLGVLYYNKGMLQEALDEFRLALEIDPGHLVGRRNAIHLLLELGRGEEAEELASDTPRGAPAQADSEALAIRVGGRSPGRREDLLEERDERPTAVETGYLAHYHRGMGLRQRGRYSEALTELELARQGGEQADVVDQAIAEVLLVDGRPSDAAPLYDALLKATPNSPKLWNESGVCHHVQGDLQEAERCYRHSLTCDAEYRLAENNMAVSQANRGDTQAARETLESLVSRGAGFPEAWCNLGLLLLDEGSTRDALDAYRAATEAEPDKAAGWLGVAAALAEEGNLGAARNAVSRAVEVDPESAEARYRLAFLLNRLGDVKGSLDETRRALALDPYFTAPRLRLAIEMQFEYSEVLAPELGAGDRLPSTRALAGFAFLPDQLEAALERLRPREETRHGPRDFSRARLFLSRGALSQALAEIRRVVLDGGDPVEAALLAGEALQRQGLQGEALERFDAARARLEGTAWSESHERAGLGRARCLLELGDSCGALAATELLAERLGADPRVDLIRAEALLALDRSVEALELFTRLASTDPYDASTRVRLGLAARRAGRPALARDALMRAIAIDPELPAARLELAALALEEGSFDEAAHQGRAALAALPGYPEAARVVADAERAAGRLDAAVQVLAEMLEEDAYHLPSMLYLGEILLQMGRAADARVALRRVLRFDPESAGAWHGLGSTYLAEGRRNEAAACRSQATALAGLIPEGQPARRAYDRLVAATARPAT